MVLAFFKMTWFEQLNRFKKSSTNCSTHSTIVFISKLQNVSVKHEKNTTSSSEQTPELNCCFTAFSLETKIILFCSSSCFQNTAEETSGEWECVHSLLRRHPTHKRLTQTNLLLRFLICERQTPKKMPSANLPDTVYVKPDLPDCGDQINCILFGRDNPKR